MAIRLGNTPVSWGVHYADDERNLPWSVPLDGIAAAGYRHLELGPVGYLPEDAELVRAELDRRGLTAIGTYLFQPPFADRDAQRAVIDTAHRTCRLIAGVGGTRLVIIDERWPERIATAGRTDAGRRMTADEVAVLARNVGEIAALARDEYGLVPVLHPHVAGYVEFEDEVRRLLDALDPDLVKLCLDTGHSAYAGIDPVALYEDFHERVAHMHFKDVDPEVLRRVVAERIDFDTAMLQGVFCPVGAGMVDFAAMAAALARHGYDGWATVEQDHEPSDPDRAEKAARGAVASREFLRGLGLDG